MKISKSDSLLHIFTGEGKTFTFHNATITVDNESTLCFEYGAMSDGRNKKAEFLKSRIVGFSVTNS